MRSHTDPLWIEEDLMRYQVDERQSYGRVSLAEECSGMKLEKVWKLMPPTSFVGPPDHLNPHNASHQRDNRHRDHMEWFAKQFKQINL